MCQIHCTTDGCRHTVIHRYSLCITQSHAYVHCIVYCDHYTAYTLRCTTWNVRNAIYDGRCTWHTASRVHYTVYGVHCTAANEATIVYRRNIGDTTCIWLIENVWGILDPGRAESPSGSSHQPRRCYVIGYCRGEGRCRGRRANWIMRYGYWIRVSSWL